MKKTASRQARNPKAESCDKGKKMTECELYAKTSSDHMDVMLSFEDGSDTILLARLYIPSDLKPFVRRLIATDRHIGLEKYLLLMIRDNLMTFLRDRNSALSFEEYYLSWNISLAIRLHLMEAECGSEVDEEYRKVRKAN